MSFNLLFVAFVSHSRCLKIVIRVLQIKSTKFPLLFKVFIETKQECIKVGCVPSTSVAISPTCMPPCHAHPLPCTTPTTHALPHHAHPLACILPVMHTPPGQTDVRENITLPPTLLVDGKKLFPVGLDLMITGSKVWCSAYWANLACAIWGLFKLAFVHAPLDFLYSHDLSGINKAWQKRILNSQTYKQCLSRLVVNLLNQWSSGRSPLEVTFLLLLKPLMPTLTALVT